MPETGRSGICISYDDVGEGEPGLLFLAGWCAPRSVFRPLLPLTSRHRRSLALDWRGHGDSDAPSGDFGLSELADDAEAVLDAAKVGSVVLFALAHAGWVAIELRKRLGERVRGIVLLEWYAMGAPEPFQEALRGMQSPERWKQVVHSTFDRWLVGATDPDLVRFVREDMGAFDFAMWSRAAREIFTAFHRRPVPLEALSSLGASVLHMYSQPGDEAYLEAQRGFERGHPWFSVHRLHAQSHFPMFEVPTEIANLTEQFIGELLR
jgi:pimeloyl-ACP methyl ester carboxylesterase